jgi:diacylglycerol kinase family enzyme
LTRAPPKRLLAIVNADSGPAGGREKTDGAIAEAFARRGIDATVERAAPATLPEATARALAAFERGEIDAIVVGGGDGTVGTIAAALLDRNVPLGILPFGTLNHFARDLGISPVLDEAVAVIASGRVATVDAGEVNGRIFVNNSSIGIYPYMVLDRERRRRLSVIRKGLAMTRAFLRVMRMFPRRRIVVHAAGRTERSQTPLLFVGNNEYGTDVFNLGKRERLDAGELWVYVAKPTRPWRFFMLVARMALGSLNVDRDLTVMRVNAVDVEMRTSRVPVAVDGEVAILQAPLKYRIRPKSLTVFVPPPTSATDAAADVTPG